MAEAKRVKLMRGAEASRLSVIPAQGEQIMSLEEQKLYLGDGNKLGGYVVNADSTIAVWADQTDATKKHSLAWWIAYFNGSEATIRIPRGTHEVLADITVPSNICLQFDKGANLEVADTMTLIINGSIEAGLWQIFSGAGTISGNPKINCVYPEWFGAVGDGTTDSSTALVKAIHAFTDMYIVELSGVYSLYNVTLTKDTHIRHGQLKAQLTSFNETKNILNSISEIDITIESVNINGNASNRNPVSDIPLKNMIRFENAKNVKIIQCEIHHHAQNDNISDNPLWYYREIFAINILDADFVQIENCYIHNNFTEQISIGSYPEKTVAIIKGNRVDNNEDAYSLFLLYNLKSGLICNNVCIDNHRTFVNIMSNNLTVTDNRIINTTSRGIASESSGTYMRLKNNIIMNNYIENASEGGIDSGLDSCMICNNVIKNCSDRGITIHGQVYGEYPEHVTAREANPWVDNTMTDYIIGTVVKDNIIINQNSAVAIYVGGGGEFNTFGAVIDYPSIYNVEITGNKIILDDTHVNLDSVAAIRMKTGNFYGCKIKNNYIKGLKFNAINIGKSFTSIAQDIDISNNNIFYNASYIVDAIIRIESSTCIRDVIVENNTCNKPASAAFYIGQTASENIIVKNNKTCGSPQIYYASAGFLDLRQSVPIAEIPVVSLAALSNGLTVRYGDRLISKTPTTNAAMFGYVVTGSGGTIGTLSGVTATITLGSNIATVNSSSQLKVGDYITIAGAISSKQILEIVDATTIKLVANATASVSEAAVSYANPTVKLGAVLQ